MKFDIDRASSTPVSEQLAQQVRFLIATGQISTGETLPSTRSLADRLGISFHTVRKAYQILVDEGLATARPGHGFVASEYRPADKTDRLEAGAEVMARAVQQLVSMGLDESEMEYLLDEQLSQIQADDETAKVVFVASFTEFAESGARRLAEYFGLTVDAVPLALLDSHMDADYVVAPFPIARKVHEKLPRADIIGIRTQLPAEAVEVTSRMFDHETLLLVVRYSDAIPALSRRLRSDAGFTGQIIAAVMEDADPRLGSLVRQADAVLYTPATARRMRPHLAAAPANAIVELRLTGPELERVRGQLPL
ncbi:MAG: GntR family transcriptional regulator [Rhodothermales bacterium]|nr:GntR family transcriptional regulator [Rhodothermales bacterium]MBO6781527.1 GntR family transcriptional regulator [Rhodothermales bacterium]